MPATPIGAIREELIDIFNRLWDRADRQLHTLNLDKTELESFRSESERMLFNFSHWLLKNDLKVPDFSELRLYSKNLRLLGIIDAVHNNSDQPILVDYKTSKNPIITDDMTRQAALYALLYKDKFDKIPEAVWIHFLVEPGDPIPIHIDEHLMDYGKILIDSVREKTISEDKRDYPCTCGGFCERDLT
jgi:PD-(D/E)XK nuclease superfamily protein